MNIKAKFFILILVFIIISIVSTNNYKPRSELWETPLSADTPLAILEFTERGNLYDRDHLKKLSLGLEKLDKSLVVVFIHGWKHNAHKNDENLISFKNMLSTLRSSKIIAQSRKIVGVYIGWPGSSIKIPIIENATFWARKSVAQEIGKGGVTEVLLNLEYIQRQKKDRMLISIGHSFGGAIMASALNEVLMTNIINAKPDSNCRVQGIDQCIEQCVKAEGFGEGVVILNPAIEANQILPLKSLIADRCFPPSQKKLLHIITTDADTPTKTIFPLGQRISMLSWKEKSDLNYSYRNQPIKISEQELDRSTIGHLKAYWTGRLFSKGKTGKSYTYCSLASDNFKSCSGIAPANNAFPTRTFEPLSVISTDGGFMEDHNDIFNEEVISYLSTIVRESITKKRNTSTNGVLIDCYDKEMLKFGDCFKKHQGLIKKEK